MNQPIDPAVIHAVLNDLVERLEALENQAKGAIHSGEALVASDVKEWIEDANRAAIDNARRLIQTDELR